MVSKTEETLVKELRPVFIPPRKRQTTKKGNNAQNYVDHIVNVQSRQKLSPCNTGLEEDLLKTSLILKNKQPLPQIPSTEANKSHQEHASRQKHQSAELIDNIYLNDNELKNFESISEIIRPTNRNETATPSSYSESSLNLQLKKSNECLSSNPSSSKKKVNIQTAVKQARYTDSSEIAQYENVDSCDTSSLRPSGNSLEKYQLSKAQDSNYTTLTGTIKRGRKKGQCFDLQINLSREELDRINAIAIASQGEKKGDLCWRCTISTGIHIFLLSLMALPFITLISSCYSFYIGTLTWYNIFNYFSEEKSYLHRIFICPVLILAYPLGIILCTLGLGIYAGLIQLSFQFNAWLNEVADIEKGFYGWFCSFLRMSDCSPYEVIILSDIHIPNECGVNLKSSALTEELSL